MHSATSEEKIAKQFHQQVASGELEVWRGKNVQAVGAAYATILAVDPSQVKDTLQEYSSEHKQSLGQALGGKLLISVVAGWTHDSLTRAIITSTQSAGGPRGGTWVIRTLPNVAAQVSQSITAIEDPAPNTPSAYVELCTAIFSQLGRTVQIPERLMPAATAVGGSTPAFWAIICDALIDASVAVGVPRGTAQQMIYQSMRGSADMLLSGMQPGELRDMGTSPEGCTIGGVMVLEQEGVRGALGKAMREAVTIARLMGGGDHEMHVNDTRQG